MYVFGPNYWKDLFPIFVCCFRMGHYYLATNKFQCAKQVFTTGCKYSPSPRMWKGAGVAYLRVNFSVAFTMTYDIASKTGLMLLLT